MNDDDTWAHARLPLRTYDFSSSDVDCLCCLPAGG